MGKRGPKPKLTDVTCPNEGCEDYGKVNNGNIIGNGTYKTKNGKVHKFHC
ncbi:MAG: IS1 family transposase, partial [Methanobrevibacter sp.]|nr:IS1 family transposase [Candidatus Methanovirga australis]